MCRLVIYKGIAPVQLSRLITKPSHSIVDQAVTPRLRLDLRRPINGDGFGIGWYDSVYDEELGSKPCIFTSILPAWSDANLGRLAEKIKSPLIFGHVRATTSGSLSQDNCHPFGFGKLMWMHNGEIASFPKIKRKLQALLSDELFGIVKGNTDSEWAFALFLSKLADPNAESFTHMALKEAMLETIAEINRLHEDHGITEPSLMNFCITDGESVVATRYISSKKDAAASLWFSSGTSFEQYSPRFYKMFKNDKRENVILVASEPLTFEKADWMEIRTNSMIVLTSKMNVLLIPIEDKFYIPDSDSLNRGTDFAAAKGLFTERWEAPPPPDTATPQPVPPV